MGQHGVHRERLMKLLFTWFLEDLDGIETLPSAVMALHQSALRRG